MATSISPKGERSGWRRDLRGLGSVAEAARDVTQRQICHKDEQRSQYLCLFAAARHRCHSRGRRRCTERRQANCALGDALHSDDCQTSALRHLADFTTPTRIVRFVPNAESLGIACGVELRAEPDQGLGQLVEYREKLVAILNRQGRALKCSGLASR